MMGRLGALTIHAADGCSFKPQPIWTKSRYKLQLMEPVKGGKCVNIGRPGALWTSGKHAPGKDNAQFMLFEKAICCAGISKSSTGHSRSSSAQPGIGTVCTPQHPVLPAGARGGGGAHATPR